MSNPGISVAYGAGKFIITGDGIISYGRISVACFEKSEVFYVIKLNNNIQSIAVAVVRENVDRSVCIGCKVDFNVELSACICKFLPAVEGNTFISIPKVVARVGCNVAGLHLVVCIVCASCSVDNGKFKFVVTVCEKLLDSFSGELNVCTAFGGGYNVGFANLLVFNGCRSGKFTEDNKNNFVVVSGFSSSDVVYVYLPSKDTYIKTTSSLEELLENTVRFFIINDEEVVK
jgi:hypothetical protein